MSWLEGEGDELHIGDERYVLRPITPQDGDRLVDAYSRLSSEARRLRFFSPHPELSAAEVERFTNVDHDAREALILLNDADRIVAVGRYDRTPGTDEAEVAFVVSDDVQGHGIATVLLQRLADHARARGIERFIAHTLPENRRMLDVFRNAGFSSTSRWDEDAVLVEIALRDP